MNAFAKRFALVFGVWTLVALCGGLADYLAAYFSGSPLSVWAAFRGPLAEQWIWAALTPLVFLIAHHSPLSRPRLGRSIAIHIVGFLVLSALHCVMAEAVGEPIATLPASYTGPVLPMRFLGELYSDIWMYWPLVCIQALIDSHARTREKEKRAAELEASLAKSHLALLRAQIQPHFLFNTLHALSALIRLDPVAAEDMVADLAEILRASSAESGFQETALRRELDLVACYLRIQQRRFGERLRVIQAVAPELLDTAVPALVLQSLVENAVAHGIGPLGRRGTVQIRVYRRDRELVLHVEDDGVGMRSGAGEGTGLANARRRMSQLYGTRQSLEVRSATGRGVSATATVPFRIMSRNELQGVVSSEHTHVDSGRRDVGAPEPLVAPGP